MINRRTLSKTPRHYCSSELFFFPSEGRKALASSSTRILKNALHKSIIVQSLLPVGMDVSMIWRSESKTSLSGFENCGQRSRMEELSRYFMVATADVYGHVWGLLWAHPEISGEGWPAGLADAGGGLWPQWPPVDASQYSRPHVGPSAWFHRAQCWPVLALSPDLIEHSGLDCVPVLSLSLKKPGSFYFSSPGSTGIYLFGCVGDTCSTWDLVSWAGFKPGPLHWACGVLATEPSGEIPVLGTWGLQVKSLSTLLERPHKEVTTKLWELRPQRCEHRRAVPVIPGPWRPRAETLSAGPRCPMDLPAPWAPRGWPGTCGLPKLLTRWIVRSNQMVTVWRHRALGQFVIYQQKTKTEPEEELWVLDIWETSSTDQQVWQHLDCTRKELNLQGS